MGIVSSRICSFIFPDSQQGVSLGWGDALLEISQEEPDVGLPLHSSEWSIAYSLGIASRNCLQVVLYCVLRLQ